MTKPRLPYACILVLSVLASLLLSSCSYFTAGIPAVVRLPTPAGPYAVGRVAFDWTDPARASLGTGSSPRRELLVWVWYPADQVASAPIAPYLPSRWAQALEAEHSPLGLLFQDFASVTTSTLVAPPAAAAAHPLVVLSTGYGLVPAYYTTLAEELASAGFLVAGIANTYSAPVVVFPDGRKVLRDGAGSLPEKGTAAQMSAAAARLVGVWQADIGFVIDKLLAANNAPSSRFFRSIDPKRIAAIGHSFGGAASAAAALSDSRIKAVVDLDGTLWGEAAHHAVRVPTMIVTSSPKPTAAESASFADALSSGALELTLEGSRHFDFSDYAVLYEPLIHLTGLLGSIPGRRALIVTDAYVKAFLMHALNGSAEPLFRGPSAAYPEMRFDTAGVQS